MPQKKRKNEEVRLTVLLLNIITSLLVYIISRKYYKVSTSGSSWLQTHRIPTALQKYFTPKKRSVVEFN